mgnify:CR=1 FL=1
MTQARAVLAAPMRVRTALALLFLCACGSSPVASQAGAAPLAPPPALAAPPPGIAPMAAPTTTPQPESAITLYEKPNFQGRSMTFDHRIVNGVGAAGFLVAVEEALAQLAG